MNKELNSMSNTKYFDVEHGNEVKLATPKFFPNNLYTDYAEDQPVSIPIELVLTSEGKYDGGVKVQNADGSMVENKEVEIPNGKYVIKDSGKGREHFEGGAVRDSAEGKPRYELLPALALRRVANLYAAGAKKYGDDDNWKKSMKFRRIYASLLRHAFAFGEGDTSEDHLAAVCFNSLAIMHYQEMGRDDLDDMPKELDQKLDIYDQKKPEDIF